MSKQSSIDWLIEKLGKYNEEMVFLYQNEIEQAKAMHKEEIGYTKADVIKAGEMGEINYLDTLHIVTYLDEAKQFNKTYGGNK